MTPGEKQRHDQQLSTLKHGLEQCTTRRLELGRELQAVTKICAEVRTRLKENVATLAQHVDALSAGRAVEQGLREEIARLTAWLDGTEHRHESGKVCVACVPEDLRKLDEAEQKNARLVLEVAAAQSAARVLADSRDGAKAQLSAEQQKNTLLLSLLRGELPDPPPPAPHDCGGLCPDFHCSICGQPATDARPCSTIGMPMHDDCRAATIGLSPSEAPSSGSDKKAFGQLEHGAARVLIDGEYQCACAACVQHRDPSPQRSRRAGNGTGARIRRLLRPRLPRRQAQVLEARSLSTPARQVRHALAEALGIEPEADLHLETVDVAGAAKLLHTTVRAIYQRRHSGQMPVPISRRPLVWRKADLLRSPK